MKMMQSLREFIDRQPWDRKTLYSAMVLSLLPIGLSFCRSNQVPVEANQQRVSSVDTHIPRGYVLVPINVLNYESLDSILGPFGVVDLYHDAIEQASPGAVARNVRILRAPQNPSHFAVLVRDADASRLLQKGNSFHVIVKPPQTVGTKFVETQSIKKRKITYGDSQ